MYFLKEAAQGLKIIQIDVEVSVQDWTDQAIKSLLFWFDLVNCDGQSGLNLLLPAPQERCF